MFVITMAVSTTTVSTSSCFSVSVALTTGEGFFSPTLSPSVSVRLQVHHSANLKLSAVLLSFLSVAGMDGARRVHVGGK
jgi:hypothetical protein